MDMMSNFGAESQSNPRAWAFQVVGLIVGSVICAIAALGIVQFYVSTNIYVVIIVTAISWVVGGAVFGAIGGALGRIGQRS
jgi:hypothetical protein